ncbi:hypothetical protein QA641_31335 [Bradyrhizobium sp. CB1650]|uniref:hypothetical protein n=1 Tax=Bradyrhizobium sp. CB1650 TaxID=3039153 RepID=UPI002435E084|nr:hypothetical protein [Bradyrhizobium sp. CB1650]WGD50091.1 hypothetical protein QA641_31335 [Bradyrhizobium sp. CB1650]
MTKLKLLPAGLIAAAMLTTPVMARHHPNALHVATDADARATPGNPYTDEVAIATGRMGILWC